MHAKYRTRPRARCTCPQRTPVACAQRLSDGTRDPMAHAHGAQLSCDCLSHSPPTLSSSVHSYACPLCVPCRRSSLASKQTSSGMSVGYESNTRGGDGRCVLRVLRGLRMSSNAGVARCQR